MCVCDGKGVKDEHEDVTETHSKGRQNNNLKKETERKIQRQRKCDFHSRGDTERTLSGND